MSAGKVWRGFDYTTRTEVERPRKEWRELIEQVESRGGRKCRIPCGDLLIIDRILGTCKIIAEVYDNG